MKWRQKLIIAGAVCWMAMTAQGVALSKEALFDTAAPLAAKVSPDGKTVAVVKKDEKGVANIFLIKDLWDQLDAKQLTFLTAPGLLQFFWGADSKKMLWLQDHDGAAQQQLYGVDIISREVTRYAQHLPNAAVKMMRMSQKKNQAAIGIKEQGGGFYDLYLLDLDSGKLQKILSNCEYADFIFSENLGLLAKIKIHADGSWSVLSSENQLIVKLSAKEAFQTEFLGCNKGKGALYLLDHRFSDTHELAEISLASPEKRCVLGHQQQSDIDEVLMINGEPKAYASYYTTKKWHSLDQNLGRELAFLRERCAGDFSIVSQDRASEVWVIATHLPDQGPQFRLYDRRCGKVTALAPAPFKEEDLAKMYPLIVKARDGMKLVCYYTLPKKYDLGGWVKRPLPLVVVPHGGPFKVRDRFEFMPLHQWLADCGYAVLSVNFRLSSGFGQAFVNAGNGEWGGKAHSDLIDAVDQLIAMKITQKGQIALVGGSYGGYAALAGLTLTPRVFTACVSICGPSHLKTVLDHVPEVWEFPAEPFSDRMVLFTKRAFITSMGGDPTTEKGAAYLDRCSPLSHLASVQAPLLLIHGANDMIVKEQESRQIYESMKARGKEVSYLLFPDEGHGIAKQGNRYVCFDAIEHFLAQHLHGSYTPIDSKYRAASSVSVHQGQKVPINEEALTGVHFP